MDYINDLHELCETISNEIAESNEKIRAAGGKITAGDVDYIDKLTHTLKSIKATIAMMDDEEGYSNRGSYADGMRSGNRGSYMWNGGGYSRTPGRGGSYARGRGRNANRDSMGRYSSDDGMAEELRGLMEDAPNEAIKRDIKKLIDKIEQM